MHGCVETAALLTYTGRAMAPPRRAPAAGAQPRRGSVERPINAPMVRGTWLLVALPLLLAAFTVGQAAAAAAAGAPARVRRGRRRDSSRGSSRATQPGPLARLVRRARRDRLDRDSQFALYGFKPQVDRFQAQIPGRGRVELANIVAVVRGSTQRAIVVTGAPRQQRRGARRERQRLRNRRADRARARVRAGRRARRGCRRGRRTRSSSSPPTGARSARSARRGSPRPRPTRAPRSRSSASTRSRGRAGRGS